MAIDIPGEVQNNLRTLLDRLRPTAKLSWSTVEKLHITTKFIGEWPEERLDEMKAALRKVNVPAKLSIAVRELGWFPNGRSPHENDLPQDIQSQRALRLYFDIVA